MTSFLRALVVDEKGQPDVCNFAFLWVVVAVMGVITFDCLMSSVDYFRCKKDCHFDPLPIAQAAGLVTGALAAALPALGGYFRLMRRKDDPQ